MDEGRDSTWLQNLHLSLRYEVWSLALVVLGIVVYLIETGAEGANGSKGKPKSRPFNARKMDGMGSPNRHGKSGPAGAPPKSAGKKKSSQARKSRR